MNAVEIFSGYAIFKVYPEYALDRPPVAGKPPADVIFGFSPRCNSNI
jgi:hypothetical protein